HPTPYLRATMMMGGPEAVVEFGNRATTFLEFIKDEWPKVRRINELWGADKLELLENELGKHYAHDEDLPVGRELALLRSVHSLNTMFLAHVKWLDRFTTTAQLIMETNDLLMREHTVHLRSLIKFFARTGLLRRYEEKITSRISTFVECF